MGEGIKKFAESSWMKVASLAAGFIFSIVLGYGIYNLEKLDSIVMDMQNDKIELIDRINTIDSTREDDIKQVKDQLSEINTTLKTFIAKTDASQFTSEHGLAVWREITTQKQQILSMQKEIDNINRSR